MLRTKWCLQWLNWRYNNIYTIKPNPLAHIKKVSRNLQEIYKEGG